MVKRMNGGIKRDAELTGMGELVTRVLISVLKSASINNGKANALFRQHKLSLILYVMPWHKSSILHNSRHSLILKKDSPFGSPRSLPRLMAWPSVVTKMNDGDEDVGVEDVDDEDAGNEDVGDEVVVTSHLAHLASLQPGQLHLLLQSHLT